MSICDVCKKSVNEDLVSLDIKIRTKLITHVCDSCGNKLNDKLNKLRDRAVSQAWKDTKKYMIEKLCKKTKIVKNIWWNK